MMTSVLPALPKLHPTTPSAGVPKSRNSYQGVSGNPPTQATALGLIPQVGPRSTESPAHARLLVEEP